MAWRPSCLGAPSQVDGTVGLAFEQMRGTSGALYIDDTWRVLPTLTVNAGLRYELIPPFYDKSQHETNMHDAVLSEFLEFHGSGSAACRGTFRHQRKFLSGIAVSICRMCPLLAMAG